MKFRNNKYLVLCLFLIVSLTSCNIDRITVINATLYNTTNYPIVILHYKEGVVYPEDTVKLNPKDSFRYADDYTYGDKKDLGFYCNYCGVGEDSIVIIFDNKYLVTHYFLPPDNRSQKYHLHESKRNIGNIYNYDFSREGTKRKGYTNYHRYYFTEDDYNFAKD